MNDAICLNFTQTKCEARANNTISGWMGNQTSLYNWRGSHCATCSCNSVNLENK